MNLDEFVLTARASWPEWPGTDATAFALFVEHACADAALETLQGADLWLAFHAGHGLPAAVAALDAACFADLGTLLRGRRASPTEADEVVQRLRHRLLVPDAAGAPTRILGYGGRGELRAWVRVAAVRAWLNLKRESPRHEAPETSFVAEASSDLELEILKGKYKEIFQRVFLDAVDALAPGTRLLLKLHYLDRLGMEEVGKVLGVHRLTVLRRLERARHELAEGTKERLESELRLDPPDVESLLRLIQSRLDVSLQGALAARSHEVQHAVPE